MHVVILDLGISNVASVAAAIDFLGADHEVTSDPGRLEAATHIVLPGVGAFDAGMDAIAAAGAQPAINRAAEQEIPVLGICLGMQLLLDGSDEGDDPGLGIVPGGVERLEAGPDTKVPHVGFSPVFFPAEGVLARDLPDPSHFYFTHSYALPALPSAEVIGTCPYGGGFAAAFEHGHVFGVQFHPEKSQAAGLRLLYNFVSIGRSP